MSFITSPARIRQPGVLVLGFYLAKQLWLLSRPMKTDTRYPLSLEHGLENTELCFSFLKRPMKEVLPSLLWARAQWQQAKQGSPDISDHIRQLHSLVKLVL